MVSDTTRKVAAAGAGLVVLLLLVGLIMYASDYGVEATVVEKGSDAQGRYILLETKMGGFEVKHHTSGAQNLVSVGNFVVYHLRSGDVQVYTSEGGTLLYDSS